MELFARCRREEGAYFLSSTSATHIIHHTTETPLRRIHFYILPYTLSSFLCTTNNHLLLLAVVSSCSTATRVRRSFSLAYKRQTSNLSPSPHVAQIWHCDRMVGLQALQISASFY